MRKPFCLLLLALGLTSGGWAYFAPPIRSPVAPGGQPYTLPYPRLGMWWPDVWSAPLEPVARYDWVIFSNGDAEQVAQIKQLNPRLTALNATNACELSFNPDPDAEPWENEDVRQIPAAWFLTQVGTTLAAPVNATQTTLAVAAVAVSRAGETYDLFVPGEAALVDGESVWVEAVNKAAKTLTVRRGYVRPASSHPAGTRIAAHVTFWPGSWLLNLSTQSPSAVIDPKIGPERWADYHARTDAHLLDNSIWDGMLIDRADPDESWLIGNSTARTLDPDQSNRLPDDSYAAFDAAWNQGLRQYEARLRQLVGEQKILFVNWGMANYDLLNGNNYEGFPRADGSSYNYPWRATVFGQAQNGSYADWLAQARQPNLTMIETYEDDSGPDPSGDGSYTNPCARPGFTPDYRKMRFGLATALLNDGFFSYEINTNGHGSLCLLWFDEYDNAGQGRGYLGQPLGSARRALDALPTPNLLSGGGMDGPADLQGWDFWADDGYAGTLAIDPTVRRSGAGSARIQITQAAGVDWQASLSYAPIELANGGDYTLSFWARSDQARPLSAWAQRGSPPWDIWLDLGAFDLGPEWQYFEVSAVSSGADPLAQLNFGLGQTAGTVWLDDIHLQSGSREVWRRDYTGGIALVNASNSPQTIDLGAAFRKIAGTQAPAVNDGSLATQVTIPAQDGLILLRVTPLPRLYLPLGWR